MLVSFQVCVCPCVCARGGRVPFCTNPKKSSSVRQLLLMKGSQILFQATSLSFFSSTSNPLSYLFSTSGSFLSLALSYSTCSSSLSLKTLRTPLKKLIWELLNYFLFLWSEEEGESLLRPFDAKLYIFFAPLHRKLAYTSMEAVCSSANNSLETHLWWKTIKAGVFKTDIIMDGFHRCAICTDKRFFFFLFFFSPAASMMDGCTAVKRQKKIKWHSATLNIQRVMRTHTYPHMQSKPAWGAAATVKLDSAGLLLIGKPAPRILMMPKAF